jgi:hypothetical protein
MHRDYFYHTGLVGLRKNVRDALGTSPSARRTNWASAVLHHDGPTTDDPKLKADSRCFDVEWRMRDEANVS